MLMCSPQKNRGWSPIDRGEGEGGSQIADRLPQLM